MPQKTEMERLEALKEQGALNEQEYQSLIKKIFRPGMSEQEKRQKILLGMLTLSVISILSGLGFIIGANWDVIPYSVKLGSALGLFLLSLMGVVYCHNNHYPNLKELCLSAAFLLIAGNMAIIQQYMQTQLTWHQGSMIWWALSVPLLFLTKKMWLPIASVLLFVFGMWEYLYEIIKYMNYMLIAGLLSVVVLVSFLGGAKARVIRYVAFMLGIFVLAAGDVQTGDFTGLISIVIFLVCLATISQNPERSVRFCHYLIVFIVCRIFLLFFVAYHNLMSIGLQLIVFGTILLILAGGYYYFFDVIQNKLKGLVHDKK